MAGSHSFDLPLTPVSPQLRREMLRSIDKKKYSRLGFECRHVCCQVRAW